MLLRDEGMLQTVFSKHVTRRKVEMALDRHALQVSGQQATASEQRASSGWAAGEREQSPAAGGGEAETTPPRVLPQPPLDFRLPKSAGGSGASARRSLFTSNQVVAVVRLQAAVRGLLARASVRCSRQAAVRLQAAARGLHAVFGDAEYASFACCGDESSSSSDDDDEAGAEAEAAVAGA